MNDNADNADSDDADDDSDDADDDSDDADDDLRVAKESLHLLSYQLEPLADGPFEDSISPRLTEYKMNVARVVKLFNFYMDLIIRDDDYIDSQCSNSRSQFHVVRQSIK